MPFHLRSLLHIAQKTAYRLAKAETVFYLLPALMIVLVAGTLAQREMGLFAAHKLFFSSFILWAGPLPLPGGYTLIGLLTLSLALKFVLLSEWSLKKSGIILAHLGTLILLGGGLLTALYARESYMVIAEGQATPFIYDYHQRELSLYIGDTVRLTAPFKNLKTGQSAFTGLPFTMKVREVCSNCAITKREDSTQNFEGKPWRGMAQFMALEDIQEEKDPEQNLTGLILEVSGLDPEQDGIYIAFEAMPKAIDLTKQDKTFEIILGKRQENLPFSLKLEKFTRESYPGTDKARAYSSDIIVQDNGIEWPARIAMNEPLRYKGYTFYQSSFEENEGGIMTILSVVENRGRAFPYVATGIIAAGLLLHIFLTLRSRRSL